MQLAIYARDSRTYKSWSPSYRVSHLVERWCHAQQVGYTDSMKRIEKTLDECLAEASDKWLPPTTRVLWIKKLLDIGIEEEFTVTRDGREVMEIHASALFYRIDNVISQFIRFTQCVTPYERGGE